MPVKRNSVIKWNTGNEILEKKCWRYICITKADDVDFSSFLVLFSQFYYCTMWLDMQEDLQVKIENPLAFQQKKVESFL